MKPDDDNHTNKNEFAPVDDHLRVNLNYSNGASNDENGEDILLEVKDFYQNLKIEVKEEKQPKFLGKKKKMKKRKFLK